FRNVLYVRATGVLCCARNQPAVFPREVMDMARNDNGSAPFLISGGGIGGLGTAYALGRQGFPVRVFEQAPEFREVGAGIQLGPNIFRVLEKIGLKDAVLADAHRPPAQEMRDAVTGKLIRSEERRVGK